MKKSVLFLGFIGLLITLFGSCKPEDTSKPLLTAIYNNDISTGWYGDTIKFDVTVECEADFLITITNNHDNQIFEENYVSGTATIDYEYVIPTDLTDGDEVKVTISAKNLDSELSETIEKVITISSTGNGETIYHHGTITEDETWLASNNHIVDGDFTVSGCHLTIEPGTVIKIEDGNFLKISGQNSELTANGTKDKPILFTSASTTPLAGDWNSIIFSDNINTTTSMKYCKIEYAGSNSSYGAIDMTSDVTFTFENCEITNSGSYGITADGNGFVLFKFNTINNCLLSPIRISPNQAHTLGTDNVITSNLGIEITSEIYTVTNATWLKQTVPYVITDDLYIRGLNNPTLNIEKGTTILFKTGTSITIGGTDNYGTLIAQGDAENIITFSSFATTPQAGDWDWIQFTTGATNCILEYCDIKYGAGNSSWGMIDVINNALVSVNNCTISNFENYGVEAEDQNGFVEFTNNTITKTSGHAVKIHGKHIKTIGTGNVFNVDANSGILVTGSSSSYNYITEDATWLKQTCPYYIEDELIIRNNSTLTIEAGAVLKFMSGIYLQVGYSSEYGMLVAEGTSENKIIFTSASPTPNKGDWGGIRFKTTTTSGSIIEYSEISYGGYSSSYKGNITVEPCGTSIPIIQDCEIHNSAYYGLYKIKVSGNYGDPGIYNLSFYDNTLGDIGQDE